MYFFPRVCIITHVMITNKKYDRPLFFALIVFGFVIALNAFLIRYPANFVLPLLKAFLLAAGVSICGFSLNLLFKAKEMDFFSAFASGLIFTTFYFYLISFFKILIPVTIILFYFLPLPLLFYLIKKKKAVFQHTLQAFFKRPAKEYVIFLFPLIYASLPSSFYDTLVYHLGVPNLYLQHQGFIAAPQLFFANTSIYYEISLIPAVFAGDMVPRLFHFLIGVIFLLFLVDFAVKYFQLEKRFILLLLLISMPITVFLLTTVKNDLLSALFILAGIRYYLENRFKYSALCWGFAMGIKYFNGLALVLFLVPVFLKERKWNVKVIIIFALVIIVTLLPLFIKNYVLAKNPFFPFLGNYFESETFDASRFAAMRTDVGKTVRSGGDLLKLPYTLSFYELGSGGIIGAQFLIFLPFIILGKKKKLFLLIFSLLFLLTGCFFTAQIRFMYAAFVLLGIFTALVYESLESPNLRIMKYLFFVIIGLNLVASFGYHERIYRSYYLYSGKAADIEEYKNLVFPSYPAIAYVNRNTAKDAGILLVGEARNYYLKRPYRAASGIDYSILKKYLSAGETFQDFIAALKRDKINYIIYNSKEFDRLQGNYHRLTKAEISKFRGFLYRFKTAFKDQQGVLYVFEIL